MLTKEEVELLSNRHLKKYREIAKVVDKGLDSVREELDQLSNMPAGYFADFVSEAAATYIITCYDQAIQEMERQKG